MCLTIMALIVLGGLGFAVWFDIRDKVGPLLHRRITFKKFRHSLSLHTKIVLSVSLFLIIIPGLLIMLVEFTNSRTLGAVSYTHLDVYKRQGIHGFRKICFCQLAHCHCFLT